MSRGRSPSLLKVKATDVACHLTDERSISVASAFIWGHCLGKLFDSSEKPFVCLRYFRRRENTFAFISARQLLFNFCTRDKREGMEKPRSHERRRTLCGRACERG